MGREDMNYLSDLSKKTQASFDSLRTFMQVSFVFPDFHSVEQFQNKPSLCDNYHVM